LGKGNNQKENASKSEAGNLKLGDSEYFLKKGEMITSDGRSIHFM
jgi:hypothetical protein